LVTAEALTQGESDDYGNLIELIGAEGGNTRFTHGNQGKVLTRTPIPTATPRPTATIGALASPRAPNPKRTPSASSTTPAAGSGPDRCPQAQCPPDLRSPGTAHPGHPLYCSQLPAPQWDQHSIRVGGYPGTRQGLSPRKIHQAWPGAITTHFSRSRKKQSDWRTGVRLPGRC